jgi:membrane protease YdiL (CAAX protease family)
MMLRILISALKLLGYFTLWGLLLTPVVMGAVHFGGPQWVRDPLWRLAVEIGGAAAVLAALIFMALVIDKRGLGTIGLNFKAAPFGLLAGTLLGAFAFAAPLAVLTLIGAARFAPDLSGFSLDLLGFGIVTCFFNVAMQEILVRSYPLQELHVKYGVTVAIVVTTIIFLAMHTPALMQGTAGLITGANIALASVMLGTAYFRTGALWLPIGVHLGWNGLQGPVLGVNVTGAEIAAGDWRTFEFPGPALLTGGDMGVEGGFIGLIGPALGLAIVMLIAKPRAEAR